MRRKKSQEQQRPNQRDPQKKMTDWTDNHKNVLKAMKRGQRVLVEGPAGTAKSTMAIMSCVEQRRDFKRFIFTRAMVETDEESMGLLPGTAEEKFQPYTDAILDVLVTLLGRAGAETFVREKSIEFIPLNFLRGRTFDNSIVIVDEVQNCTEGQIKTIGTRLTDDSKLYFLGDTDQCDFRDRRRSGLPRLSRSMYKAMDISPEEGQFVVCQLTHDDIKRGELCKVFLQAWNE